MVFEKLLWYRNNPPPVPERQTNGSGLDLGGVFGGVFGEVFGGDFGGVSGVALAAPFGVLKVSKRPWRLFGVFGGPWRGRGGLPSGSAGGGFGGPRRRFLGSTRIDVCCAVVGPCRAFEALFWL